MMMMMKLAVCVLTLCVAALPARAQDNDSDETRRVQEAATVLTELASTPDRAIPRSVLERAEAIAIFPSVKKAGFVVGGQWGRGVISVRNPDGSWSAPAFLRLAGGSFGAQIGAQAVDLVLVVMISAVSRTCFATSSKSAARPRPPPVRSDVKPARAPIFRCAPRF